MMKKVLGLLFLTCYHINARHLPKQCPEEQETNWKLEQLLEHEDCDKFYKCVHGLPVEMFCPGGLYFNPETTQCDWKHNVDCNERNEPDHDSEKSDESQEDAEYENESDETDSSSNMEDEIEEDDVELENNSNYLPDKLDDLDIEFLENGCPTNSLIHWLLPHEDDCNLFYYCVRGEKVQKNCPSSLHFNNRLQVCDWPDKAGCEKSDNNLIDQDLIQKVEAEVNIKL